MPGIPTPAEAEQTARALLAVLRDRWQHTQRVAAKAAGLAGAVDSDDRELLVVAAWWHDLGYSPQLGATGLHQLHGARYLTTAGYPERLRALVAHHSAATFEAEERGMAAALGEWPQPTRSCCSNMCVPAKNSTSMASRALSNSCVQVSCGTAPRVG